MYVPASRAFGIAADTGVQVARHCLPRWTHCSWIVAANYYAIASIFEEYLQRVAYGTPIQSAFVTINLWRP